MKKFIFFARVSTWLSLVLPFAASAQDSLGTYPNYVVIGAFASQTNAVHFTDDANKNRFPAKFQMNPNRNLYYVYVITTDDREYAFAEALRLRTDTRYFDTWVYSGALGDIGIVSGGGNQDFDPATRRRLGTVGNSDLTEPANQERSSTRSGRDPGNAQAELNSATTQGNARRSGTSTLLQANSLNRSALSTDQSNGQAGDRSQTLNADQPSDDLSENQQGQGNATDETTAQKMTGRSGNSTRAQGQNSALSTNKDATSTNGSTPDNGTTAKNRTTENNGSTANNKNATQDGSVQNG